MIKIFHLKKEFSLGKEGIPETKSEKIDREKVKGFWFRKRK